MRRVAATSASLLILCILLSAAPAHAANTVYWLGAKATAVQNTGIQSTFQVQSFNVPTGDCLSFWVSESEFSNGYWGQIGWYACSSSQIVVFYQIWELNNDSVLTAGDTTAAPGMHTFSMTLGTGTTWSFALDGTTFGTVDFKTDSLNLGYPLYAVGEEQAAAPFAFPQTTFSTAIDVRINGQWQPVSSATVYSAGGATWGIQANAQNSGIPQNSFVTGQGLSNLGSGTLLWSSTQQTTSQTSSSATTSSSSSLSATTSSSTTTSRTTQTSATTSSTSSGPQVTGTYIAFVNNAGQPVPGVSAKLMKGSTVLGSGVSNSGGQIGFGGFSVPMGSVLTVTSPATSYNGVTYAANTYTYTLNNNNQFNADYLKAQQVVCTSGCNPPPPPAPISLTMALEVLIPVSAIVLLAYALNRPRR